MSFFSYELRILKTAIYNFSSLRWELRDFFSRRQAPHGGVQGGEGQWDNKIAPGQMAQGCPRSARRVLRPNAGQPRAHLQEYPIETPGYAAQGLWQNHNCHAWQASNA